jgi:hypothetical protein
MMRKLVLLSAIVLFSSCRVAHPQQDNSAAEVAESPETILFLVFKMGKNSGGKSSITLISKTKAAGKLKKGSEKPVFSENYLIVDLLQNNKPTETLRINHPLYKVVEYVDDDNKYKSKLIELDQQEFFFRLQVNGEAKVRISETVKNTKTELLTLKI